MKKIDGTSWSSPNTNIIAGMNTLRQCLASGENAVLLRAWNEECKYPISVPNPSEDLKNWEFRHASMYSENEILACNDSEFSKNLSLNYKTCYGEREAVDHYYETGELSVDNFNGVGVSHIVKREDAINFWTEQGNLERAGVFEIKKGDENGWFDKYTLKNGWAVNTPKKFKRKVWVVQMVHNEDRINIPILVHIIAAITYPLKWIPEKSVLQMDNYKNITFSLGDVTHGFSIEIQIPKKFSF